MKRIKVVHAIVFVLFVFVTAQVMADDEPERSDSKPYYIHIRLNQQQGFIQTTDAVIHEIHLGFHTYGK